MGTASGLSGGEKLRLLFILDSFPDPHAGTEGQFWLLFNELDRALIEPTVLLLRPSKFLQAKITDAPVKVLDVTRLRSAVALWRIMSAVRWARRQRFDVAHIFFNDSSLVFPMPLKLAGIRVIVSRRDLGFWYTKTNLQLLRLNRWFVDVVVANCAAVKTAVARAERYPEGKIRVIHNGSPRVDVPTAKRDLPLTPTWGESPLIVMVANLRPLKRIEDGIRALALLNDLVDPPHLIVVGEDMGNETARCYRAELQNLAETLGVSSRVHFVGKQEDPIPFVQRAAVCLLCSETEGLSNSIIEYMLAGKPVVCTDVGGNTELVASGENGFVVPVGDVESAASCIGRLLSNPRFAEDMGAESRRRALELFHPRRMKEAHQHLYETLWRPRRLSHA